MLTTVLKSDDSTYRSLLAFSLVLSRNQGVSAHTLDVALFFHPVLCKLQKLACVKISGEPRFLSVTAKVTEM